MASASTVAPAIALLAALQVSGALAEQWGASLTLTSDYIVRGVTRSDGDPSIQGDLHCSFGSGWLAGLSAGTARLSPYEPITAEVVPYAGYSRTLGPDWHARVMVAHYDYPGSEARDQYRYDEISTGLGWRNLLSLSLAVLPDTSIESTYGKANGRPAFAADLAGHAPLGAGWSFNAGLGYYDLHDLIGVGYPYWNSGLAYDFGSAQFNFSYIGTNATAKSLYYDERAGNRWAATLIWHFL